LLLPFWWWAPSASAAEVLQVNGPNQLVIGDRNRSATVILGCIAVESGAEAQAQDWLRQHLPRQTRVNLRPLGERDGRLVAKVSLLKAGSEGDLADGLVTAGLARSIPCT